MRSAEPTACGTHLHDRAAKVDDMACVLLCPVRRLASKFSANNPRQPQPQSQSLSQQRATAADESLYMDLQHRMERVIDAERRHASALAAAGDPARGVLDSILTLRAHLLRGAEAVELQHAPGDDWLPEDDRLPYVEDEGVTYRVARKGGQEERERGQVPEDPDLVAYPYDEGQASSLSWGAAM